MWLWKNNKTFLFFFKYLQAAPSLQTFFGHFKEAYTSWWVNGSIQYVAVFWYEEGWDKSSL